MSEAPLVDPAAGPRLDPAAVRWSDGPHDAPLLVLLHGYGADEHDLYGLTGSLGDGFAYAAVRAPLSPPWPTPGYSWYAIEARDGRWDGAVTAAGTAFLGWLDDAVGSEREVGLLGFSQGGAVALQALRLAPERFRFVVNLAGYAADGALPGDAALTARRPPVFWGRGTADAVIPTALVDRTAQWLPSHSTLRGGVYPGLGHAVSAEELTDVRAFLDDLRPEPGQSS